MIVRFIARLFVVAFAYSVAAMAAGITFAAAISLNFNAALSLTEAAILGLPLGLWFGFIAAAPALVAIALGEMAPFRSWIFYALAGALTAIGSWSLFDLPLFREIRVEFSWLNERGLFREIQSDLAEILQQMADGEGAFLIIAATGLAGGLAYWMIAGHASGNVIALSGREKSD